MLKSPQEQLAAIMSRGYVKVGQIGRKGSESNPPFELYKVRCADGIIRRVSVNLEMDEQAGWVVSVWAEQESDTDIEFTLNSLKEARAFARNYRGGISLERKG